MEDDGIVALYFARNEQALEFLLQYFNLDSSFYDCFLHLKNIKSGR